MLLDKKTRHSSNDLTSNLIVLEWANLIKSWKKVLWNCWQTLKIRETKFCPKLLRSDILFFDTAQYGCVWFWCETVLKIRLKQAKFRNYLTFNIYWCFSVKSNVLCETIWRKIHPFWFFRETIARSRRVEIYFHEFFDKKSVKTTFSLINWFHEIFFKWEWISTFLHKYHMHCMEW